MQISTLYKTVLFLTSLLVLLTILLFLQNKNYIPPVTVFMDELKKHQNPKTTYVDTLQTLYSLQSNQPVELSLALDQESIKRISRGLKHKLNTVLDVQKEEKHIVKYILQLSENGKQYFEVDPKEHKLKGAFKTFKHYSDNGTLIIKLVPVNPAWIKG